MVTRLGLLVVLWVVVTYYFPDSRQFVKDTTEPLWEPVVRWNTQEEMGQVARDVATHESTTGQLPSRRDWLGWLDYRYTTDDLKRDAWGNTYELRVLADSVGILSYGPDMVRNTEDDLVVTAPRTRPGR